MPDTMNANVDLILNGQAQGDVAGELAARGQFNFGLLRPFIGKDGKCYATIYKGGNPQALASYARVEVSRDLLQINATLRRDEWKQLDDAILDVSTYRLGGIDDLIANNLTFNLGNAMGTTVLEWHDVSDALEAEVTMDGVTRAKNDGLNFQTNYLPIPIIHADYEINARQLAASRSLGNGIDVTLAQRAARKVNEKLENMLFTNTTYAFGAADDRNRNKIYSYLNHPDRNQVTLAVNWDASASTAAGIIEDVKDMKQASMNAYHYGPWMLYIPSAYELRMDDDYSTSGTSTQTIRDRIMKLGGIKGIKVIDTLPANNVLLVQMTSDVVRLVRGMGLQNVEWSVEGKFITKFKVMTIQVPQIRSDQNGKSGIVHLA